MSATAHPTTASGLTSRAVNAALAGIACGIVLGMLMAMIGMLTTVAKLAGSDSAVAGGLVHLATSAGISALFAGIVPATRLGVLLGADAVYGMMWWALGPLVIGLRRRARS